MKILVTGAGGFIGKNLISVLHNMDGCEVLEFHAKDGHECLQMYCAVCDFVFHLAGVNRPEDEAEFETGNVGFTRILTGFLAEGSRCPIVFSSSVQTELDNPYGRSKRGAEKILREYEEKTGTQAALYRLPNVFGKWCRPDYNSVIATFCHHTANGLLVHVRDENQMLRLVYIDDVVAEFVRALKETGTKQGDFYIVPEVYERRLGDIANQIQAFSLCAETLEIPNQADAFTKKLYSTYLSYLPEEKLQYALAAHSDAMATDISKILPLNDFPATPYETSAASVGLQFRWIHAQCFQFRLPDGKVLMTDPFFPQNPKAWKQENTPMLDLETLGPVDYVTINHSHFDHTSNLPDVFRKNSPIVICDRIFARELSAAYQIPEYNIWPIVPGMSYSFPSFRLDTVQGRHNDIGDASDLNGARFADPANPLVGPLNSYGCLFNTSFLFTLTNNFRIGFAAGVDVDTMAAAWKNQGLNLLLRQRLVYAKPEEFTKDCEALGGQLIVPMHHDACFDWNSDMNAYAADVNRILSDDGCPMRMFNPQRMKWYTVQMGISIV